MFTIGAHGAPWEGIRVQVAPGARHPSAKAELGEARASRSASERPLRGRRRPDGKSKWREP